MDKERKLTLLLRSLGLRHKLKVHESMSTPDSHEELALMMSAKWELEDELAAIEELLAGARRESIEEKKQLIVDDVLKLGKAKSKAKALASRNGKDRSR